MLAAFEELLLKYTIMQIKQSERSDSEKDEYQNVVDECKKNVTVSVADLKLLIDS